jgi:hypothetical protein
VPLPPLDVGIGETVAIRIYEPLEEPVPAPEGTARNPVNTPKINFGVLRPRRRHRMTAVSGLRCRCCGQRPSTLDSGWCRACLDAEDRRRETLENHRQESLEGVHFPDPRKQDLPVEAAEKASISPDKSVHYLGPSEPGLGLDKVCPVCRRRFLPRRDDQVCCRAKCRRVKHRLDHGDPTAEAALRMLIDPAPCEGCGRPLFDMRVGARVHGDACRKRAKRRSEREGAGLE